MFKRFAYLAFLALAGCFQTTSDDTDLRTVPVTNNPHIVPGHGILPGMGAPGGSR
ncbi:MAG: hypothetical protein KGJ02_06445 [Verrucomicrobiota bacterium]|nr:hypothetical protein [Verrucomicrobiota bacterium]